MPATKHTQARIQILDACLRRQTRQWTLNDLVKACVEQLSERFGTESLSRRTIQRDLQTMRREYDAPVIVEANKYYRYADPDFTLARQPLTEKDTETLGQVLGILRSYAMFDYFHHIEELILRIEEELKFQGNRPTYSAIQFEQEKTVQGLEHLQPLYQYIIDQQTLGITYHPFGFEDPLRWTISPYLLKQHNSRWYLMGWNHDDPGIYILGLDRILAIELVREKFIKPSMRNPGEYFRDVIGVSVPWDDSPRETIRLRVEGNEANYIRTRPIHHSQQVEKEESNGVVITLQVIPNPELKKAIQRLGPGVEVLSPDWLRQETRERLEMALAKYQ